MFDSVAEVYQLISEARDVLMDEQKREAYNKKHKAMLARKSRRENMDKRQRELTESLLAREEAGSSLLAFLLVAKRRRNGEMTEKERLLYRIRQVKMEDEKTIEQMLHEQSFPVISQGIAYFHSFISLVRPLDYSKSLIRVGVFVVSLFLAC